MTFRYARHTENLSAIIQFYTEIIGLKVLGKFENHSDYNGVFPGFPDKDWHLEFTESKGGVEHKPDKDDLLVFYLQSADEWNDMREKIKKRGLQFEQSQNPYWQKNGLKILDPDGFGVIRAIKN